MVQGKGLARTEKAINYDALVSLITPIANSLKTKNLSIIPVQSVDDKFQYFY